MGIQLMAELDRLRPQLDDCLRGVPSSSVNGSGTAADPAAVLQALETAGLLHHRGPLDAEQEALLLDFEAAAIAMKPAPTQRTLVLEIEPLDREVRIIGVASGSNGSGDDAHVTCAQQELSGKVLPVPAARVGRRTTLAFPLRSMEEGSSPAMESSPESEPAPSQDRRQGNAGG
jgi:hypothetical protein